MLYDKNWDQKVKADPFALSTLIGWLETKDPAERYVYECNGKCLLAQYFTAQGFDNVCMGSSHFHHGHAWQMVEHIPESFDEIAISCPLRFPYVSAEKYRNRHTFGAALERARQLA